MSTSADTHTLTGGYALDAVDGPQRHQFEKHLAECPACTDEVDELRATAAQLGIAVAEPPPERLRARVLEEIARTRQQPPITGRPGLPRAPRGWTARPRLVAAAVAVAAAVGLGASQLHAEHRLDAIRGQLAQARDRDNAVAAVLGAGDVATSTVTLPGGGSATVVASRSRDQAVLTVSGMSAPPARHAYQTWLVASSGLPRSAGLLQLSGAGSVTPLLISGLDGATGIRVTLEPAGGSPQPTTNPVMSMALPA